MEVRKKKDQEKRQIPCKYGIKCYQKNSQHHAKYSHPSPSQAVNKNKRQSDEPNPNAKRSFLDVESPSNTEDEQCSEEWNEGPAGDSIADEEEQGDVVVLPPSPENIQENIKQKFLTDMPDDFYSFWDFCKTLDAKHPEDALQEALGLRLVGPFDVLSGKIKRLTPRTQSTYLIHCRYYFDPPEFQTVIAGEGTSQFHLGYFRDSPDEAPSFVAGNEVDKGCLIKPYGENLFAAVKTFVDESKNEAVDEPNRKAVVASLKKWAEKFKFPLDKEGAKMKARKKKVVTKCFHGAGIVVPYDKKTEAGYRPLPETDGNLKKILSKISSSRSQADKDKALEPLQQIITLVQFANDERDYGMGLELGLDLFCYGDPAFRSSVLALLPLAYELLGRPQFAEITRAHMAKRSKVLGNVSN